MERLPSRSRPDRLYGLKPPAPSVISVVCTMHVHDMRPVPPVQWLQIRRRTIARLYAVVSPVPAESSLDASARPRETQTQRPFCPGARGHSLAETEFPALLDPESTARRCRGAGERRPAFDDMAAAAV